MSGEYDDTAVDIKNNALKEKESASSQRLLSVQEALISVVRARRESVGKYGGHACLYTNSKSFTCAGNLLTRVNRIANHSSLLPVSI